MDMMLVEGASEGFLISEGFTNLECFLTSEGFSSHTHKLLKEVFFSAGFLSSTVFFSSLSMIFSPVVATSELELLLVFSNVDLAPLLLSLVAFEDRHADAGNVLGLHIA
jgi:hypothetical protein